MESSWFYTNTFDVKDHTAFASFCREHGLELFGEGRRVGCCSLEVGLPAVLPHTSDEGVFLRLLGTHLQDGYVAVVVDASITQRERCDVSWQITYAVNNRGHLRAINPAAIFDLAHELGAHVFPLQDMQPGPASAEQRPWFVPAAYRIALPGGRTRMVTSAQALWETVDEIALWCLRRAARTSDGALPDRGAAEGLLRQLGSSVFQRLAPKTVREYAALMQVDEGIWESFYAPPLADEEQEPTPRRIFDTTFRESIIAHLAAHWESLTSPSSILRSTAELAVFTEAEARAIRAASQSDPWKDQDGGEAPGSGFVFPVKYLAALEGLVIPAGITGNRAWGLWIDGYLTADVLASFQEVLGRSRIWRAWPASDFALVLPAAGCEWPMVDPVLQQLAEAVPLEDAFPSLADMQLTFVELDRGYLVAQNAQRQFEAWWRLPDDGLVVGDPALKLEYEGDLYCWCGTRDALGEIRLLIAHELGKS